MPIKTINQFTNKVVRSFDEMTDIAVYDALSQAQGAFNSWKQTTFTQRAGLMHKVAALMRSKKESLAKIVTLKLGKLISQAETEIDLSAKIIYHYADNGEQFLADVVLNPEYGIAIEDLFSAAGAPKGLFTSLLISGRRASALVSDMRIKDVSLTGSEAAAVLLADQVMCPVNEGTRVLSGGERLDRPGAFMTPTIRHGPGPIYPLAAPNVRGMAGNCRNLGLKSLAIKNKSVSAGSMIHFDRNH